MAEEKKIKYLPKDEEEKHFTFVNRQIKEHPVVKVHHPVWKELIEWTLKGNQFSEFDRDSGTMKSVTLKVRKKRVVVNLMKPLGEALQGKLNLIYQIAGTPNSSEMKDIKASRIATKMLSHNDDINHVDDLLEEMEDDLINTGNAWITWQWDEDGYGFIPKDEGNGAKKRVSQPGEVMGRCPSVFNIRPDPTATKIENMRWLIEIMEVPRDELIEKFNLKKEDFEDKSKEKSTSSEDEDKFAGMNEPEAEKDKEEITDIVAFYWEKKTEKYPKGRLLVTTGKIKLKVGPNPTSEGLVPFFHFGFKRAGNSIWHTGPMFHVQPIQREINRMISIISEHIEGWRAKMVVPRGAIIKEGSFTTDSFELLEVDESQGKVHPLTLPELSPQVAAQLDRLMMAVDKVSNVHEVTYAQLPKYASRAPATLFSMMLEQENLKIDPMLKRINKTILQMGRLRLMLMDKNYTQPRLVKVVGKGEESSIEYFKGADLAKNFDVRLTIAASLHQSKAIQQRLLIELKQAGILEDNNKILKLLNMGDISEELRGDVADETRAMRENQAVVNGTQDKLPMFPVPPNIAMMLGLEATESNVYVHDNHELHMDYHTNMMKGEEASDWDDAQKAWMNEHIDWHFRIITALKQMTMVAGAPTGAGAAAPTPPGTTAPPGPAEKVGGTSPDVSHHREVM